MNTIYKPKGAAAEYGDYAVNIYTGCPHRCYYCFAPNVLHREREVFHSCVEPRKGIVEELRRKLEREQITGKLVHLSVCRNCGAEIDWARKPDGGYIPVDPEPVFVIEGEGQDKFYAEEEGELTGRAAGPGEIQTLEQKINTPVAFVPHWRTCRKGR